jgi:hypothetical protein
MKYIASLPLYGTLYYKHYFYDIETNKIYMSVIVEPNNTPCAIFYGIMENNDILKTYKQKNYESVHMPFISEYKIVDDIHDVAKLINDLIFEKIINNI